MLFICILLFTLLGLPFALVGYLFFGGWIGAIAGLIAYMLTLMLVMEGY